MNNFISLSVQPGKIFYNVSFDDLIYLASDWDCEIFEQGDALYLVKDDIRLHIYSDGHMKAFVSLTNRLFFDVVRLFRFIYPKVLKILREVKDHNGYLKINLHFPSATSDEFQRSWNSIQNRLGNLLGPHTTEVVLLNNGAICVAIGVVTKSCLTHSPNPFGSLLMEKLYV